MLVCLPNAPLPILRIAVLLVLICGKWPRILDKANILGLLATIPPSVYPFRTGKNVGAALVIMAASYAFISKSGSTLLLPFGILLKTAGLHPSLSKKLFFKLLWPSRRNEMTLVSFVSSAKVISWKKYLKSASLSLSLYRDL